MPTRLEELETEYAKVTRNFSIEQLQAVRDGNLGVFENSTVMRRAYELWQEISNLKSRDENMNSDGSLNHMRV